MGWSGVPRLENPENSERAKAKQFKSRIASTEDTEEASEIVDVSFIWIRIACMYAIHTYKTFFVILKIFEDLLLFLGLQTARLGSFKRVGTFYNLLVTDLNIMLGCGIIMSRGGESKKERGKPGKESQ